MPRERVVTENLERGYSGTAKTIDKMHRLVAQGKLDPTIQKIANWIRLGVHGDHFANSRAVAEAIFRWVKHHGVFQPDPFQIEKIEHPIASTRPVIELKKAGKYDGPGIFVGDCDTFAIWIASLGGALGFQSAFETAKVDGSRPDEFSHVWAALLVGNEWVPLDASTPGARPGWRPPVSAEKFKRWEEKPIEEALGMSGLNGHGLGNSGMPKRDVPFSNPAILEDLVPDAPARSPGDYMKVEESLYRAPARRAYQRDALMLTQADVPRYQNYGASRVPRAVELSTPYPYNWPWAHQVEVVDPGVVGIGSHRRRRGGLGGGMGYSGLGLTESEIASMKTRVNELATLANSARAAGNTAQAEVYDRQAASLLTQIAEARPTPTPSAQAAVEKSLTSQIFDAIGSVTSIFTGFSAAKVEEEKRKAAALVANATAKVTGQMGGTYAPSSGSPYTLPLVIGGGALVVGTLIYFATKTSSPRRR